MTHALVDSLDKVIENIARYQNEVGREPRLVGRTTMVRAWYADRVNASLQAGLTPQLATIEDALSSGELLIEIR